MSQKILIPLALVFLVVVGIIVYVYKTPMSQLAVTPLLTPTPEITASPTTPGCSKDQLTGILTSQGAAGSIYVDVKITNISTVACNVNLGNSIVAQISANNITTKYQTPAAGSEEFNLAPNASLYSRLHFPNGPQCSGSVNPQSVSFVYDPKGIALQLKTSDNKNYLIVQACQGNENTQIDIWPVLSSPIK